MITVLGRRSSINVQKVLWALAEAGVGFERETVGGSFGGNDTKEFRKLNPMGLVPVFRDGRFTLFESNAIMRYVARKYGRGSLAPRGTRAFGLAEQWVEWTGSTLAPPVGTIFWNKVRLPPEQFNAEAVKQAEKLAVANFKIANRILGKKPFVAGKHFSYGDIPLGAFYWRYHSIEPDRPAFPNLDRWFASLMERKPFQDWIKVPVGRNIEEWQTNERSLR